MDLAAVRTAFDEHVRREAAAPPNATVERTPRLTRAVASDGSWIAVLWSDLTDADADRVVAAEVQRYGDAEHFEWKHYSGDAPDDLTDRLRAAGLVPEPPESVLVADLDELDLPAAAPEGVRLVRVEDFSGVEAVLQVHREAFDHEPHPATRESLRTALAMDPPPIDAVLAYAGDRPVCAGRVEYSPGGLFAGLYGGGTVPDWRGRGVFRALVAWRADVARRRGARYLFVDALPSSRPILERLGFAQIAETTPFVRAQE